MPNSNQPKWWFFKALWKLIGDAFQLKSMFDLFWAWGWITGIGTIVIGVFQSLIGSPCLVQVLILSAIVCCIPWMIVGCLVLYRNVAGQTTSSVGKTKSSLSARSNDDVEHIDVLWQCRFDKTPNQLGWKFKGGRAPNYVALQNPDASEFQHGIRIMPSNDKAYALDCKLKNPITNPRYVEFVGTFDTGKWYILLSVIESAVKCRRAILQVHPGDPNKAAERVTHSDGNVLEWEMKIWVEPEPAGRDWKKLPIDVSREFERAFGDRDVTFESITGFRLRGPMDISQIRVLGKSNAAFLNPGPTAG